ncbi:MAG TPA: response regulator, partial [Aquabacterium sp.]|uniref:response regulator n=1 Tax=Aquabacterium sp. TaxID=1872578 RepID=UPI002E3009BC
VIDPGRLKQVLYNYLSNAIKFTPEGGCVTVRAFPEGPQHFRLEVEDTGIGIAAADLPRLFVDFQQLDAGHSKQHPGTGLGLALTRRLVEAQGGQVGVRSTPGVGSVFHVVLQRVCTAPPSNTEPARHRLLMIENQRSQQAQVIEQLSSAGFHVDTAPTGEQALAHARDRAYDAITLDLLLPDQHGLGTLASIRREGPSQHSPVLAVTMPIDGGDTATFAVANVLSKPIRTQEVVAAMAQIRPGSTEQPGRVMVIDDDPYALDLMRATLSGMGLQPICLLDGRQALQDIDHHQPDAIILDLMMPEFDGFAVLDALHRMPLWQHTPVFIWTSMILTDEEYENLARSARAVLSKGGGALANMLQAMSRWRPPVDALPHEDGP